MKLNMRFRSCVGTVVLPSIRARVSPGFLSFLSLLPRCHNVRSNPATMVGRVLSNYTSIAATVTEDGCCSSKKEKPNQKKKIKETCPVGLLKNSVVKIFFTSREYSKTRPWETIKERNWTGSGFAISGKRILTNAHVVAEVLNEPTSVQVKKRGSTTKYKAKVQKITHECDLAILEIDSQEFWKDMNPLELGDIPPLKKDVCVLGYARGNRIWITKGSVTKYGTEMYCQSDTNLLRIHIHAIIKKGNSGGPVILENKVVGVAFGNSKIESFLIPTPIVKRFITGGEESDRYAIFGSLGLSYQSLKNAQIRNYFKMSPRMTGVMINEIDFSSGAYGVLKKNDIILAIDGVPIANDETVPFLENERVNFNHLVSMKKPGETTLLKVLRRGKEHEYNINLKPVKPHVTVQHYYKRRSYYIFGGFVFVPNDDLSDDISKCEQHVLISEVKKVNRVNVKNLRHLCELVEENRTKYLSMELEDDKLIVLNYESAKEATSKILKRHNIESAISEDLIGPPVT